MKLKRIIQISLILLGACFSQITMASDKATPEEVYQMVLKAAEVLEQMGEEGLAAFGKNGEFVWKDSYVWVVNCSELKLVAHPNKKLIGLDLSKIWDKNKDKSKRKIHNLEMCKGAKDPNGAWVEYYWEKLGEKDPARKVSFILQVPDQPYQVTAGIYDKSTTIEELSTLTVE